MQSASLYFLRSISERILWFASLAKEWTCFNTDYLDSSGDVRRSVSYSIAGMAARWRLVRKAFIRTDTDRDTTFQTNNFKFIDDPEVDDSERKYSKMPTIKKFSFLQVVREATQRNANVGRKPRPTLMKFLEKFDTLDIPACVPRTDQRSR